MAERVVSVTLRATVADYKRGMMEAAAETRKVGTEAQKLAQVREAMQTVGAAGFAMGAALAAGVGVAVARFAEFDQAMSNVAATGDDARENLDALRDAAIEAGASTVFSATEAANAIEEMAKAGVSARDILAGGLTGALDLAAAGGLGVAEAAGIAATTLQQFELKGSDASHVADLLAAGAGKAMGEVTDLSGALAQSGLVANQFGISVDETVGTLAAFASAGMLGSDSGTSFRTMLLRLANPTGEAAALMKELNINAYDAGGQFVGMAGLAGQLEAGMAGLTQEQKNANLAIIFGQDAIRGANVLLKEGAAGISDWTDAVNDQGYAAETAATRLDNLVGDWEKLTGAMDSAFISMAEGVNGPLRWLVQGLTSLVDGFNGLPEWAKQGALGLGLLAAGVGLVGGAFLLAIPKIAAFKIAMLDLGLTGAAARAGLSRFVSFLGGPWGVALFAATAAFTLFQKQIEEGIPTQAEISNAIKTTSSAVDALNVAASRGSLETFFAGDYKKDLEDLPNLLDHAIDAQNDWTDALSTTFGQKGAYDSLKRFGEALAQLAATDLPAASAQFRELAKGLTDVQVEQLLREMPALRDELLRQAEALGISADSAKFLQFAMGELPAGFGETEQAAALAAEALDGVVQALSEIAGEAISMAEAKDEALSAINAMTAAAEAEGVSLNGTNDASIRLRDSVREVEQAHRDSAQAIIENGGTLDEAQAAWQAGRDRVIEMRMAMGESREEAIAWADQNLGSASQVTDALAQVKGAVEAIPESKHIRVTVDTSQASRGLNQFVQGASGKVIRVKVAVDGASFDYGRINVSASGNAAGAFYSNGVKAFADSGFESGLYAYKPGGIHKFAEEYDEVYLSGDPRRRARTEQVWQRAGQEWGLSMPSVQVAAPSLEGMALTGTFELVGDGLVRLIDGRLTERARSGSGPAVRSRFAGR